MLCGEVSLCVVKSLKDYSFLTAQVASVELKSNKSSAFCRGCCEWSLCCDLFAGRVFDDFAGCFVHEFSFGGIGFAFLQTFVFDHICQLDFLLRKDIFFDSAHRGQRADLRNVICDGFQVHKAILGLLIHGEIESLQ